MKSLFEKTEYTIEDIYSLIENKAEESLYLEFKAAQSLSKEEERKTEISRDISAFANADGGILIYGLSEKERKANKITFIDSTIYSKDWLQSVIDSRIARRLTEIQIIPIDNPDNHNEQILLVKIKPSNQAPHAAYDKMYYRRNNKGKIIMEEYEVRESYNRSGKTDLILHEIRGIHGHGGPTHGGVPTAINFYLKFFVQNIGNSIESLFKLEVKSSYIQTKYASNPKPENAKNRAEGDYIYYTFSNDTSLFQNEIVELGELKIEVIPHFYELFNQADIVVKLYYSNGVKEYPYKMAELLRFMGREVRKDDMLQR